MKEIRFRAWDGKRMYRVWRIEWSSFGSIVAANLSFESERHGSTHNEYWSNLSDTQLVLMQYTGLKDKNGVDIYEGDILGVDGESFGAVNWCEDCAAWGIGSKDLMLCEYAYSKFEVIGNIHQHTELLDGS